MVRISNLSLIQELMNNSRLKFTEIGRKFGVTETAIRKRVKKLEADGVIKKYTIEADMKKLGFEINALIGIDTTPEDYVHVIDRLKESETVKELYSSSGDHMLMVKSFFRNHDEMSMFVKEVEKMKGVTRVCPATILERLK